MDILSTYRSFPVHNFTDYPLEDILYSEFGFKLFFRPVRGVSGQHFLDWLNENEFDIYIPKIAKGLTYTWCYTYSDTLDISTLVNRRFVLSFVSGEYGNVVMFDGKEFYMKSSNMQNEFERIANEYAHLIL
jgi:hypothetical protein